MIAAAAPAGTHAGREPPRAGRARPAISAGAACSRPPIITSLNGSSESADALVGRINSASALSSGDGGV